MQSESSKKIRLTYFDLYGRAEMIRLLLTIGRIPYEDVRLSFSEWPDWKAKHALPFGQLPILEMDGKTYAQSACILRILSKKFGFYPEIKELQFHVEFIHDLIDDAYHEFWARWPKDKEKLKAYHEEFMNEKIPGYSKKLNELLLENYPNVFFLGDGYTLADFAVLQFLDSFHFHNEMKQFNQKALAAGPQLEIYWKLRSQDLKEYFARRPPCPF